MLYPTTPGMTYAVEADGAIEVINASGVPVYTGENALVFPAVGTAYTITPDTAEVKQLFKLAPRTKLHLLMGGAGGWLPRGFTELEYLENNGKQRINTGIIAQDDMSFEYQFILENYGNSYLPLFGNPNGSGAPEFGIGFIDGIYRPMWSDSNVTALMCDGKLPYGVDITVISERDKGTLITPNYSRTVTHKYGSLEGNANKIRIGEAPWFGNTSYVIKHKHFVIKQEEQIILDLVPVLDANGTPCMFDKISRTCFPNKGTGSFIVGLTMKQLPALRRLPTVTSGELTLSLPWEAQLVMHGAPAILESVKNRGWTLIVQYAEPDAESAVYNKYAACKTVADMIAVNPDYRNDLTSEKEWIYPLSNLEGTGLAFQDHNSLFYYTSVTKVNFYAPKTKNLYYLFYAARIKKVYIYAPNATNGEACFRLCRSMEEVTGDLSSIQHGHSLLARCYKMRSWSIPTPKLTNGTEMFYASSMLEDVQTEFPALSMGKNMFNETILNKESILRVANSLPSYTSGTHEICFGIHVDHQSDEEVLAALEAVEARGWTLTVQWNGTATAAATTYGLRRPPVYAKPGTIEHPDGTTEQMLDWGHYVTAWEENGYAEFSSLEEAYEHFNLTQE